MIPFSLLIKDCNVTFMNHKRTCVQLSVDIAKKYFREFGILLLPYLRDQKDWDQLLDVIEEFGRLIPASSPMFLQDFQEMEKLLND